jgi:hypothetical protein
MENRSDVGEAICEIVLVSSGGRRQPPVGFTMLGDMDGLNFCYKNAPVPSHTKNKETNGGAAAETPQSPSANNGPSSPGQVNVNTTPQPRPNYYNQGSDKKLEVSSLPKNK